MASRYAVAAAVPFTWDGTAGTKWATTSGGAGGASVPTASDDVFFDSTSGTGTITIANGAVCQSWTCTGYTGTATVSASAAFTIGSTSAGSLTLVTGMTFSMGASSAVVFGSGNGATYNLTSAGKTFAGVSVSANTTTTLKLIDALTCGKVTLTQGKIDTNGQTVSMTSFSSNNTNTRSLLLGASSITVTDPGATTATPWDCGAGTGLTLNAGTSTITLSGAGSSNGSTFAGGGKTWNNVVFSSTGTYLITGTDTFNNFTYDAPAGQFNIIVFPAGVTTTVSSTIRLSGSGAGNRLGVQSSTTGTTATISAATAVVATADFMDITATGASAPWAGTNLADAYNNSGITFLAVTTRYWVPGGTNSFANTTNWASTSGGTSGATAPLCQDAAIFDANSFSGNNVTVTSDRPRICRDLDFSAMTNRTGCSIVPSTNTDIFGSIAGAPAANMVLNGTQTIRLRGRSSHALTNVNAGASVPSLQLVAVVGTYTMASDIGGGVANATWFGNFTHTSGTLDLGGFNLNCLTYISTGAVTRALTMGSGSITLNKTGAATYWNAVSTGFTLSGSSGLIIIRQATSGAIVFIGAGLTYGTLRYTVPTSTGSLEIQGANSFDDIQFSDASNARTLTLPSATTTTIRNANGLRNLRGTSGKLMSLVAKTGASAATVALPNGYAGGTDFLSVQDITATTNPFYAGANSTNVSGNTNVIFSQPPSSGNMFLVMG